MKFQGQLKRLYKARLICSCHFYDVHVHGDDIHIKHCTLGCQSDMLLMFGVRGEDEFLIKVGIDVGGGQIKVRQAKYL